MALIKIIKKKSETKAPCACSVAAANAPCVVKVLGSGCKNCRSLFENIKEAVENIGLNARIEHVTDMQEVMKYGAMSMPALVVNEKLVSQGRVLKAADAEKLLRKLGF